MMHQEGKEDLIDRPSFFAPTFSLPERSALSAGIGGTPIP